MPTVKITDSTNLEITSVPIESNPLSALTKYVKNDAINLIFLPNIVGALKQPVLVAASSPLELNLQFGPKIDLGSDKPDITIDAGASAAVHVAAGPSENLFADQRYGAPVSIDPGVGYVSLALGGSLDVGVSGGTGAFSFGVSAGGAIGFEFFRAFPVTATAPTVAQALGKVISNYVIPGDLADLGSMQRGDIATVSGSGSFKLSASANLLAAVNPLASVNLPLIKNLGVKAGASLDVSASFQATGEYQIRVRKLDDSRVELGYYKKSGAEFKFDLGASAGVSATLGKVDLIQKLVHAVSKDPEADIEQLVNGGLTDDEIKSIQDAIAASINRSLQASLELAFSAAKSSEAAFLYQIDLSKLDSDSEAAVQAALNADLTELNDLEASAAADGTIGAGVKLLRSRLTDIHKRSLSWKINLLGILNFASFSEMIRKSEVVFEPATGDLTISETVSGNRIAMLAEPFRADGEKLRKAMFDSLLFTTAFRATRTAAAAEFTSSQVHFAMNQSSTRQTFSTYLDGFIACGLMDASDKPAILAGITGDHTSTYLLRTEYDDDGCAALFLDSSGNPFTQVHYEQVGRKAMADLLQPGEGDDPDGLRHMTLTDDGLWAKLKDGGQFNFFHILPAPRNQEPNLSAIIFDYTVIEWWVDAMVGAAQRLAAIRKFIGSTDPSTLEGNKKFTDLRDDLQKHFRKVVSNSKVTFGKPWGLTALYQVAKPKVAVTGIIVSPAFTRLTQVDATGTRSRNLTFLPQMSRDLTARDTRVLTGEEKETMRPYVIDLRMGAFSNDGQFTTSQEDVDRIFGEELPAELDRCKAAGRKLQLMFYAHGGLIDELNGLLPVLRRLPFWRNNGIYPIFFVWETGLQETVADIVKSLFTGARALSVPNPILEALARQGGLAVWNNMKRSAQLSSLPTGGALSVAEKTRDFWQQNHADMQIHACGHSAGSIFHSYFLPALLSQKPVGAPDLEIETLHFLAPACTTQLFEDNLLGHIGAGKGIKKLSMYTMHKDLELADKAGPYNASLLYLVSRAFEPVQPTPILGLEESIRKDSKLLRFFGLAGFQAPQADLLFSKTAAGASPRSSTVSTSHGDFDNDIATMNSVVRRTLDIPDSTPIFSFVDEGSRNLFAPPPAPKAPAPLVVAKPVKLKTSHSSGGKKLALCIGIDDYPAPYQLGGCVADAGNWTSALTQLKFNVTTLVNASATRSAILDALRQMIKSSASGDVVVLQYAGHGTQVQDQNGDEDDGMDEALCPIDFPTGAFIIDDDLREIFQSIPSGVNVTSFMDCCHSGTITRVFVGIAPANLAPAPAMKARFIPFRTALNQAHLDFRKRDATRALAPPVPSKMKDVLFSACEDHEVAYESNGSGAFTFRAVPLLKQGIDGLTNSDFKTKVIDAFGPSPLQTPGIDCAPDMNARGFLKPIV